ncbi:hypothetical protein [Acinetobacter gerneri]|uniref:hypothetical protein n=1 Tax=Acinetobacter gerneri TaxID=202952 RepID=UPI0028AB8FE7|nr:hypothetical protein [Acinetobacter gerneri]
MKTKIVSLALSLGLSSTLTYAKPAEYTIVHGGGVDDISLEIKDQKRTYDVYCQDLCGNWFLEDPNGGGEQIDPKYVGRKVLADFKLEANKGRIIGPAENEKLYFFKSLKLLNKK